MINLWIVVTLLNAFVHTRSSSSSGSKLYHIISIHFGCDCLGPTLPFHSHKHFSLTNIKVSYTLNSSLAKAKLYAINNIPISLHLCYYLSCYCFQYSAASTVVSFFRYTEHTLVIFKFSCWSISSIQQCHSNYPNYDMNIFLIFILKLSTTKFKSGSGIFQFKIVILCAIALRPILLWFVFLVINNVC